MMMMRSLWCKWCSSTTMMTGELAECHLLFRLSHNLPGCARSHSSLGCVCLSRLAELLTSRSRIDGQLGEEHGNHQCSWLQHRKADTPLSVCLPLASGSTFLQRLYRICCTALDLDSLMEHWPRLLHLAERHSAFHTTTRNRAGQTLLHTICSRATYQVRRAVRRLLPDGSMVFDEVLDMGVMNRAPELADKLCRLLQRAGADFNSPDKNGQQPAAG